MERQGWRFIFDQDGIIVFSEGQAEGDLAPRKEWQFLDSVEFEYGKLDLSTHDIIGIDPLTKEPILKERPLTPAQLEQRRIQELEDALLLQADNEIGGIL